MGFHNLAAVTTTQRVKPDGTNWETTAATGTITSGTIDTLGYEGILITTTLGTVTSTGTISQTFNSSPDASTWSAMKYASAPGQTNGTTITATAGSTNTKQKIVVDIYPMFLERNEHRFFEYTGHLLTNLVHCFYFILFG